MVLVDTSAWVEVFRKHSSVRLDSIVAVEEIVTCLPVVQEVLQGFGDERAFHIARQAMLSFPMVEDPLHLKVFEEAVQLYRVARRTGLTIRSGVDCLISACAIRHNLLVLHHDRDFDALATVSQLRTSRIEV